MWEADENLLHEIAQRYVDEEKGVELEDLLQEGRLAQWLIETRYQVPVQPWHIKLVMAAWKSHIRNREVAYDVDTLAKTAAYMDTPPAESARARLMRKEYLNGGVLAD